MSLESLIKIDRIYKSFESKGEAELVLKDISFDVMRGETVSILGQSGCGKSTLLNLIGGFENQDAGSLIVDNAEVTRPGRKSVMLFQDYGLLPWRSVQKNVELGLEQKDMAEKEKDERADHYLKMVGLQDKKDYFPRKLSGGMRQRTAIARALAIEPEVLLMDEPFGALDTFNRYYLQDELLKIQEKANTTIVLVTHDIDEAIYLSDRVIVMGRNPGTIQRDISLDDFNQRDRSGSEFQHYRSLILKEFELGAKTIPIEYNI